MSSPEPKPSRGLFPGYAVPAGSYTAPRMRRTSYIRLLRNWGIPIAVVAVALVGVTMLVHKPPARYVSCAPVPIHLASMLLRLQQQITFHHFYP